VKRREFITLLGSAAAAWPLAARAQQARTPLIGFLSSGSQQSDVWRLVEFRRGLSESGYVEGRNVMSQFRWAEEEYDRLPALATELARSQPAVIVAVGGPAAALAAKAASTTIPIVFTIAGDPVKLGLVASVNRPGGNATGITTLFGSVVAKQLETLHEMLPKAPLIGCLANSKNPNAVTGTREAQDAARTLGLRLQFEDAGSESEIDAAFAAFVRGRVDALLVITDPVFNSRPQQLAALAARHRLPAIYAYREFAAAGGGQLWKQSHRALVSGRRLCWPHSQGREAGRPADPAEHKGPANHKSQHRQGARP
jgi:putative tryptophan/tyrosine transport system substrate-binding protein